ncbi:MAG: lipopolysaccharide transport periplasmic protein LptA [Gammaproteobacteria bacterium]|nr:lipopolysaccharide transport periplasmic protein LptA [Gammaproteobacteria bacterium]
MKPLLLLLLFAVPGASHALSNDRDQPVEINADSAELREKEGYAIYTGTARMKRGSLEVDAEKIQLFFKEKKFSKAVIYGGEGHRAYFQQRPSAGEALIRGTANRIVYETSDNEIRLINKAVFCQNGTEQQGERMVYNTQTNIMKAKGRTRIVFHPENALNSCDHIRSDFRK